MQAVLDEIIEKVPSLDDKERDYLMRFLQKVESKSNSNGGKNPSPNIEWLKIHRDEYAGNYVALKDGELIASAKTIKEVALKAKEKGVKNPFLHYIPAEDEEVWGGW
jgi:hypothetical protein